MSFSYSVAKAVFPSETGEIVALISEILSHIPSATMCSEESADLINNRINAILALGSRMSEKFNITDYDSETQPLLLKQIRRYRFLLESLDNCAVVVSRIQNSHIRDLQDIEVILSLLQEEIEKEY
jgi:hypothetical protein